MSNDFNVLSLLHSATSTISPLIQDAGNLIYGAAGFISPITQHLNNLPIFGMICSGIEIADALLHSYLISKNNSWNVRKHVHTKTLITLISNGILFDLAYKNASNVMSIGSTALDTVLSGFAIKAAADFLKDGYDYFEIRRQRIEKQQQEQNSSRPFNLYESPYKEENNPADLSSLIEKENQAKAKFLVSTLNLIGWGALAFAHSSSALALGTLTAPALMIIGSLFLIAAASYGFYTSCYTHDRFFKWPTEKSSASSTHDYSSCKHTS
jgi:hypothetical protein